MRCADEAHGPAGTADSRIDFCRFFSAGRNQDVADTFARKAEGFTVGIADDRILIDMGNVENRESVLDDFTVRFIGDEVNRVADFFRLLGEQSVDFFKSFFRIDDA